MQKTRVYLPFSFILLYLFPLMASAFTFEILGQKGKPMYPLQEQILLPGDSVGSASLRVMNEAKAKGQLQFIGYESGIVSINELGNDVEVISDTRMKAHGWCFSLNGKTPELMPDKTPMTSPSDRLVWFYAYALYDQGQWITQCTPDSE